MIWLCLFHRAVWGNCVLSFFFYNLVMQGIKVDMGSLLDISTSSVFKYKDYMSSFKSRLEQQEKTKQTKLLLFLLRILSMLPLGHQSGVPGESRYRCPWHIHHSSRLCVSFQESSTDFQGTLKTLEPIQCILSYSNLPDDKQLELVVFFLCSESRTFHVWGKCSTTELHP